MTSRRLLSVVEVLGKVARLPQVNKPTPFQGGASLLPKTTVQLLTYAKRLEIPPKSHRQQAHNLKFIEGALTYEFQYALHPGVLV
mmetsp:Transcript_8177/g.20588  ORF Transcript_8177/g.20588 Transcript_8177/m.20588 type:complete len:85 (+) Transcript_8177:119-373(+)